MRDEKESAREKLIRAVEEEIKKHSEWCSPRCQTFLPDT